MSQLVWGAWLASLLVSFLGLEAFALWSGKILTLSEQVWSWNNVSRIPISLFFLASGALSVHFFYSWPKGTD